MTVQINDVLSVRAKQLLDTERIMNTFYVKNTGGSSVNDSGALTGIQNWVHSIWNPNLGQLSTEWFSDTIQVYNVTQDAPLGEIAWGSALQGTNTNDSLPYQIAALVTFPTGVKRSLGKKYFAGFTEAGTDGAGIITSGLGGALANMAAAIMTGITAGTTTFTIGNYQLDLGVFVPYISALVETLLSTQRRRKPGVGA